MHSYRKQMNIIQRPLCQKFSSSGRLSLRTKPLSVPCTNNGRMWLVHVYSRIWLVNPQTPVGQHTGQTQHIYASQSSFTLPLISTSVAHSSTNRATVDFRWSASSMQLGSSRKAQAIVPLTEASHGNIAGQPSSIQRSNQYRTSVTLIVMTVLKWHSSSVDSVCLMSLIFSLIPNN